MRRVDPFLDPAIAIVAVAMALASLLTTDVDAIDPRLHEADGLAVAATVLAAGSLAWRRKRPVASYAVFVAGALVVSASFHYIGVLSLLMLLSLFSLATHGSRRAGLIGLVSGDRVLRRAGARGGARPADQGRVARRGPARCFVGGGRGAAVATRAAARARCGQP